MKITTKIFVTTIALILVGAGCSQVLQNNTTGETTQENTRKAPEFSLEDYSGNTVSLSDFAGKHVVINSWAAWCPFCRKELSDFATVQKEFENDLVIIAIDRQESLKTAKKYSDELGITDDLIFLLDSSDSFYRSIGGFSMPETIFVEPDGTIQLHKRGVMALEEIRQRVSDLLQ